MPGDLDRLIDSRISHYLLKQKLGEGGMGAVYLAEDLVLHRKVALKFLLPELSHDAELHQRFSREAIAASALNHPNICTIHAIEHHGDQSFIVMEYISGRTLREWLESKGALAEEEAIRISLCICDALTAAHGIGIIHRDIKPENIMITANGQVKLMDFGLAKLAAEANLNQEEGTVPETLPAYLRLSSHMSQFMGTLAYMSPEQIRHEPLDHRSDLFSLGLVLYEMVHGQSLLAPGLMMTEAIEFLQHLDSQPVAYRDGLSPVLKRLIRSCLRETPWERPPSASVCAAALRRIRPRKQRRLLHAAALLAAAALLLVAALAGWQQWRQYQGFNIVGMDKLRIRRLIHDDTAVFNPSLSPDGRRMAYFTFNLGYNGFMRVYDLVTGRSKNIDVSGASMAATWRPDGGAFAVFTGNREIAIFDTNGVQIQAPIQTSGLIPRWSPDGRWILAATTSLPYGGVLYLHDVNGGEMRTLAPASDSMRYLDACWSPDGRFIIANEGRGSLWRLMRIDVASGERVALSRMMQAFTSPQVTRDGRFLYFLNDYAGLGTLTRMPYDTGNNTVDWKSARSFMTGQNIRSFSLSADGNTVYYSTNQDESEIDILSLSGQDKELSRLLPVCKTSGESPQMAISPDGDQIAFESFESGIRQIWVVDVSSKTKRQLTFDKPAFAPCWSPDGDWIAYDSGGGDQADIFKVSLKGGVVQKMVDHPGADWMPAWNQEGQRVTFLSNRSGSMQVWWQDIVTGTAAQVTRLEVTPSQPQWHPDGRHITFLANRDEGVSYYQASLDGGEVRLLATIKTPVHSPPTYCLSRDGQGVFIAYSTYISYYLLPDGPLRTLVSSLSANHHGALIRGYAGLHIDRSGRKMAIGFTEFKGDIWVMEGLNAN